MPTAIADPEIRTKDAPVSTMKALVYHGPGRRSWEDKPRPRLSQPTDAIVRVSTTTVSYTHLTLPTILRV